MKAELSQALLRASAVTSALVSVSPAWIASRRMLARAGGRDVGDRGRRPRSRSS